MKLYRVGTSGWSYPEWKGVLYPESARQADFLELYAARFTFAEMNATYYRMPLPGQLKALTLKVPPGFMFSVKLPGSLTHNPRGDWKNDARLFCSALEELAEAGCLSCALAQFPSSFHYKSENRSYLAALLANLRAFPCAVEFRNAAWQRDSVGEGLKERGASLVATDHPGLPGLGAPFLDLPAQLHDGGGFRYLRLHGRNTENWWTGDATSRYDYDYSTAELETLADHVAVAKGKGILYVAFNNHSRGRAVVNAEEFEGMLDKKMAPLEGGANG